MWTAVIIVVLPSSQFLTGIVQRDEFAGRAAYPAEESATIT